MLFKPLTFLATVLSVSTVTAQLSPNDVIAGIEEAINLGTTSLNLAEGVGGGSFNLFSGLKVANSLRKAAETVGKFSDAVKQNHPNDDFPAIAQLHICQTIPEMIRVYRQLFATVVGKNGIYDKLLFTGNIATILRKVEQAVDTFAFGIIELVPTCADAAKSKSGLEHGGIGNQVDGLTFGR